MSAGDRRRCRTCGAHFEPQRLADKPLEFRCMTRRRPQLQLGVARRAQLQQAVFAAIVKLQACDRLRMTAVESFRETQYRRKLSNSTTPLLLQVAVLIVAALGRRLAMVACNQRDDLHLVGVEPSQVSVPD
jgi:hypothetical protein